MNSRALLALTLMPAVLIIATSGCATVNSSVNKVVQTIGIVDDPAPKPLPDTPKAYTEAVQLLEARQFDRAVAGLQAFLVKEPTTAWTQAAIFNLGRALEGLERWSEAAERYRAVIGGTSGRSPRLQAYALYRLSFCHEALGLDSETVATLKDALDSSAHLEREIGEAELPARLAAAYARVGNHDQADVFYERAEAGIARLKRDPERQNAPVWLPRTLYYMGSLSLRRVSWDEFELALRPLRRSQSYLLQAAEFETAPWSEQAAGELAGVYRDLWTVIEKAPLPPASDPLLGLRKVQERQWDLAALVLEHLAALRAFKLPPDADVDGKRSELVTGIFKLADEIELKIAKLYLERPAGEGLTPESVARQNGVRGRVVSPDNTLESLYKERSTLPEKREVMPTLPATQIPDSSGGEDPNL